MVSTARIERPQLHHGGSASKNDGCLLPHIILRARASEAKDQRGCRSSVKPALYR